VAAKDDVDARHKAGHDEIRVRDTAEPVARVS